MFNHCLRDAPGYYAELERFLASLSAMKKQEGLHGATLRTIIQAHNNYAMLLMHG